MEEEEEEEEEEDSGGEVVTGVGGERATHLTGLCDRWFSRAFSAVAFQLHPSLRRRHVGLHP